MSSVRDWFQIASSPPVLRRSLLTCGVVGVILTAVNHGGGLLDGGLDADHVLPIVFTFLVPFVVATISSTTALRRSRPRAAWSMSGGDAADALRTFPDSNPDPVLRMTASGRLLYANPASAPLLRILRTEVGNLLPEGLAAELTTPGPAGMATATVESASRSYRLRAVRVPVHGFINIYASELTGQEALESPAA